MVAGAGILVALTASTESPAERIAGDLALAFYEGDFAPGEPLPSRERLMASYDVRPPTVEQALRRLSAAGIITGEASQAAFAPLPAGSPASQALTFMAVPAVCRRLAVVSVGGGGPYGDPGAVHAVSEAFLAAGRRAIRGELTSGDAQLVTSARQILQAGRRLVTAATGSAAARGPGARGPPTGPGPSRTAWQQPQAGAAASAGPLAAHLSPATRR